MPTRAKRTFSLHDAAFKWIAENPAELKRYAGLYVAVTGSGIIANATEETELWKKIRKAGATNPLVMFAPGLNEA